MQNNCEQGQNETFPPVAAIAYTRLAGIGRPADKPKAPSVSPLQSGASLGAAMSRFDRPIPQPIVEARRVVGPVFTQGGFRHIKYGLLLLAPPILSGREPLGWTDRAAELERQFWPDIWTELHGGRLTAFGLVSGSGIVPIDKSEWARVSPANRPDTIAVRNAGHPVTPLLRVGDLEWFMPWSAGYTVWTADQALMWICTRDRAVVDAASPRVAGARLGWEAFVQTSTFRAMSPGRAMLALKDDLQASRLVAWSGLRALDPITTLQWEWQVGGDGIDALPFVTMKDKQGEAHGLVFDPVRLLVLYPPASEDQKDAVSEEPQTQTIATSGPMSELPAHRQAEEELKADLRQLIEAWRATGQVPADRPGYKEAVALGATHGFKRDPAVAIFKEVRGEYLGLDWSTSGRRKGGTSNGNGAGMARGLARNLNEFARGMTRKPPKSRGE